MIDLQINKMQTNKCEEAELNAGTSKPNVGNKNRMDFLTMLSGVGK